MARKVSYEQALVAHGWVALDPLDTGVIEKLFKKDIREGEEKLMLAVLEEAVKCFQEYVLATRRGNKVKRRKSGFSKRIASIFSPLRTSVKP